MTERLPSGSDVVLNAEIARRILVMAATKGTVDPDIEIFLNGIVAGKSRQQIHGQLGSEKYSEAGKRAVAYAAKLENGSV